MDTAQIHELTSKVREFDRKTEETRSQLQREVRELDRKIEETRSQLQREVREVDWKVQMLRIDAFTKDHALAVVFVVWFVVMLLAIATLH